MPYSRTGVVLVALALLAASVVVLAGCSQPTPTAELPEGDVAPTTDEVAPGEAQVEEDYPAPEEGQEPEGPSDEEQPYPPPPTPTPTLPPGYVGPDETPEETPEPEE